MSILGCLSSVNDIAFLPSWIRRVAVWGHGMTAPSCDRLINLYLHRIGLMGSTEKAFLERHLAPGMNVVDVGANQGLYTLLMARLVRKGMVYAFEPDPQLFAALENNCRANGIENVALNSVALGSCSGSQTLYRSRVNGGDNRLTPSDHPDWFREVRVAVLPLDAVLPSVPVDWIKIDVQGFEYEVLQGMEGVLLANPGAQIYFEFWPFGLQKAGCHPAVLLEYLMRRGYEIFETTSPECPQITNTNTFCHKLKGYRYTNLLARRATFSR